MALHPRYVEDVAWAVRLAALDPRASGRTFNLGEADALTQLEWVGLSQPRHGGRSCARGWERAAVNAGQLADSTRDRDRMYPTGARI
jgi:nucleoside-diphosphate-sugar epimerase